MLKCSKNSVKNLISEGKIEKVIVECNLFVFVDSIERYQDRAQAGEDFLQIPQNGRVRRAEVILEQISRLGED